MHDATFRILCGKKIGPLKQSTVMLVQKRIMISYNEKKEKKHCYKVVYNPTVDINFVCI